MRHQKHLFRILTCILSLLLSTSSLAQGLDVCKGECCEAARKATKKDIAQPKPCHKETAEMRLPLCNLHSDFMEKFGLHVPQEKADRSIPVCCHLKKAEQNVQGLFSPTSPCADRFSDAGIHTVLSNCDALNSHRNQAIAGYEIHPRAAPVPLYLRNASFIC